MQQNQLFDLAQLAKAPLAAEAVRRIDAIFDVERAINGLPAGQRLAVRQDQVAPLVTELEGWKRAAEPGCPDMPTSAGRWATC